jgi:4-alpha-glucanotransferase
MKIDFLFGVHCHQPVGNFDHVFEKIYAQCYLPFFQVLSRYPGVRLSVHVSGPLWEWIEAKHREFFELAGRLVERDQIEMVGGCFYEPILSVIPERDAVGQMEYMKSYLKRHFRCRVKGAWTAERVWEPSLPKLYASADVDYTLLDDTHFRFAGIPEEKLFGYYQTEHNGSFVKVFPIDKQMRYLVPFRQVSDITDYFKKVADSYGCRGITLFDDGEKFGSWPGTYKWVYEEGYLENLFRTLEKNSDWIHMKTFSEYISENPPEGTVYLPTASYEEMSEWSLPAKAARDYADFVEKEKKDKGFDSCRPFIRGGTWRNFFVKYRESAMMNGRTLYLSGLIKDAEKDALRNLWKAQCNCPYWHGLFGGVYLNYLRHAIYENIIAAEESFMKAHRMSILTGEWDFDRDGFAERIFSNHDITIGFTPTGGGIFEWDNKKARFNFLNTIKRYEESYHDKILAGRDQDPKKDADGKGILSIHDIADSGEKYRDFLVYDSAPRYLFMDRFFSEGTEMPDIGRNSYQDLASFFEKKFDEKSFRLEKGGMSIVYALSGCLRTEKQELPFVLTKKFHVKGPELEATYVIRNTGKKTMSFNFGMDLNMTFLTSEHDKAFFTVNAGGERRFLTESHDLKKCRTFTFINNYRNFSVECSGLENSHLFVYPVETVSHSESGFDKVYQGTCFFPWWMCRIEPSAEKKFRISLNVKNN